MIKRNKNLFQLKESYLFPEINKRKKEFLAKNPSAKIISLGVGNTTEPLTPYITQSLKNYSIGLGKIKTYTGYGDGEGLFELRAKIAKCLYNNIISAEEVFISDGAKCDIGRIQFLFGGDVSVAIQDPAYPVYVDGSIINGIDADKIIYMQSTPENNFFPDLKKLPRTDLIYFCSPNNPTGAVATKKQLSELVQFAKKNKSIIIFDAAYAEYISDKNIPKSIFEISGSREVAIELNSFSKTIGFTGVRLGWSIVPNELKYENGFPIQKDWNRIITTIFNGASNIAQFGGLKSLDKRGLSEMKKTVAFYKKNAQLIKNALNFLKIENYGGENSPYIWAKFGNSNSWDTFNLILEKAHIVTTPGSGFGPCGDGFIRFSAFGHRSDILEAIKRLKKNFKK